MQAIILAAGLSTRMYPLTLTKPKPLLPVANKPLIEHTLNNLEGIVDEAIIVIGYLREQIKDHLGESYKNIKLTYVEQKEQKGAGHALWLAKENIKNKFILLPADDYYSRFDLEQCLDYPSVLLVSESKNPERFGVVTAKHGLLEYIEEKPQQPKSCQVSTMCFVLPEKFINYLAQHHDLTIAVNNYTKEQGLAICDARDKWMPLAYPWDLLTANEFLLSKLPQTEFVEVQKQLRGPCYIQDNSKIKIGKGTIIKKSSIEGNVVIGDNCIIGPDAYIRGATSIGNNCIIGHSTEVKNSIIMNNSSAAHKSGILDSIIGECCNLGAGTECANARHDGEVIRIKQEELISTERKKFGFIMGDNVKTGVGTLIAPGRTFWPNTKTEMGWVIKKNKK
ncbi:NTP transferase domain-containing protein [Candidatus Woesearchaeota archaeon]|nr:NTP transferase domain-containing protein [Candidatus Woesearchaeota archaeon]